MVFDKFADARPAIDVRNDFEQEIRRLERGFDLCQVGFAVFVSHCADRNSNRSVIQDADKRGCARQPASGQRGVRATQRARCLKDEPGTLNFEVLMPHDDNTKVMLYEVYQDEAASVSYTHLTLPTNREV